MVSLYQVGTDGKTAYQRVRGRSCKTPIAKFGERVLYKEMKDGKSTAAKIDSTWHSGIWLGLKGRTGEHIVGTSEGVVKAYTVRRRSEDERWSVEEVNGMKGTPSQPKPGGEELKVPVRIQSPETPIIEEKSARSDPRGVRTTRAEFEKYGWTEGCEGCNRMRFGGERRPHTAKCRKRMLAEMEKDDKGKRQMQEAEERKQKELARRLEEEDQKEKAKQDRKDKERKDRDKQAEESKDKKTPQKESRKDKDDDEEMEDVEEESKDAREEEAGIERVNGTKTQEQATLRRGVKRHVREANRTGKARREEAGR